MKQRILTALLALAVFLPLAVYGKWPFTVFIFVIAAIGVLEFVRMRHYHRFIIPVILSIGVTLILISPAQYLPLTFINKVDVFVLYIIIMLLYTVISKNRFSFDHVGYFVIATLYAGIGFFYMVTAREAGLDYFFYALIVVWTTDTGAYLTGRKLGKHKLMPAISPNKTVEGALGGVVLAGLFAGLYQFIVDMPESVLIVVVTTIIASIAAQLGDLVESAFKRHYNVKDTGRILPGHGGVLDRFDSMLFVFPVLYLIGFI